MVTGDEGERRIPIRTAAGTFEVWTKRRGAHPKVKVLLLHGGPGLTHDYFEPLAALDAELIYYDQLGSGRSDHPDDEGLWCVERFVDELEQVCTALELDGDSLYLLGHSWGAILAVEFALAHPGRLKGLIVSNMMMSMVDYAAHQARLVAGLDPELVAEVRALTATGAHADPRITELLFPAYYLKHLCRLAPWPPALMRSFVANNPQVQRALVGLDPLGVSGRLAQWDRKADLAKLELPVLVIGATHDTMDPEHMRWIAAQVPHGTYVHCPDGSHCAMWDDQAAYLAGVAAFLRATADPPAA